MLNWLKKLFTAPDLKAFASNGALIIDVRTKEEYKMDTIRNLSISL